MSRESSLSKRLFQSLMPLIPTSLSFQSLPLVIWGNDLQHKVYNFKLWTTSNFKPHEPFPNVMPSSCYAVNLTEILKCRLLRRISYYLAPGFNAKLFYDQVLGRVNNKDMLSSPYVASHDTNSWHWHAIKQFEIQRLASQQAKNVMSALQTQTEVVLGLA